MPGKALKREEHKISEYATQVVSEATLRLAPAVYGEDANGKRITLSERKTENVPFTYYKLTEAVSTEDEVLQGVTDIFGAGYSVAAFVEDLNYGLEQRTRNDYQNGLDPSITDAQRKVLNNIRPLMAMGYLQASIAAQMLVAAGMAHDRALALVSQPDNGGTDN
jgi:hypothetical protein